MLTLLMIQLTDHMLNIRLGTLPETAEPCTRIPTKHISRPSLVSVECLVASMSVQ